MQSSTIVKSGSAGLILAIFSESLLSPAGIHLVSPSLPLMRDEFASHPWADTLVPMIITLPSLLIALCAPFMGTIADRIGVRPLLIGSTLIYLVIGILPHWLHSLPAILATRFVFGAAESALAVCGPPLIAAAFVAGGRQKMIGGRLAAIGVASMGLAVAGGWAAGYGWRSAYLLYGFAAIPLALILLFVPNLEIAKKSSQPDETSGSLLPVLGLSVAYGTGISVVFVYVPFLLREIGYTAPSTASALAGLGAITTAIAAIAFPFVTRLIARNNLFWISFALMASGAVGLALASDLTSAGAGVFVLALGLGFFAPTATDYILETSPPSKRGRATGLMMMSLYIGTFVAPFGIKLMVDFGLTLSQAYYGCAAFYLTFVIVSLAVRPLLSRSNISTMVAVAA